MREVRYTGNADIRRISKDDLENVGVKGKDLEVDVRKSRKVEVTNEVADYLVEHEDFEFADEASGPDVEPEPTTSLSEQPTS